MKKLFKVIMINLLSCLFSYGQDTTVFSNPSNGFFWIDTIDSARNTWIRMEYSDSILFSKIELDSSKYYPIGEYIGYYVNGNIAFKREYFFDGEYSEIHGKKQIFFPNGRLKESGQYFHNIKIGKWIYFNENGDTLKTTEYNVTFVDTITNSKYLNNPPISTDTINIEDRKEFSDHWPIIDYGKNGFEVYYEDNIPRKLILFEHGVAIRTETKLKKIKKLATKTKQY